MSVSEYFRDMEIANNGGFFCQACLVSKPLDDISPDPRYCQGCLNFLGEEAIILGLVNLRGKKPSWVPVPGRAQALPVKKKVVAKLPDPTKRPSGVLQHAGVDLRASTGIMQHTRGRPRKEGKVHRVTEWRRRQGVLL